MWRVEDIEAIPVELDFSSSGQGRRRRRVGAEQVRQFRRREERSQVETGISIGAKLASH
jgi:hypothetical protein